MADQSRTKLVHRRIALQALLELSAWSFSTKGHTWTTHMPYIYCTEWRNIVNGYGRANLWSRPPIESRLCTLRAYTHKCVAYTPYEFYLCVDAPEKQMEPTPSPFATRFHFYRSPGTLIMHLSVL